MGFGASRFGVRVLDFGFQFLVFSFSGFYFPRLPVLGFHFFWFRFARLPRKVAPHIAQALQRRELSQHERELPHHPTNRQLVARRKICNAWSVVNGHLQ